MANKNRISDEMVTTALELPGYRLVENRGVTRGIIVRSRSVVGNFLGGIESLFGGNISVYTSLCEQTRADAYDQMIDRARQMGANAIVGFRYESNDIMGGITEVLAYGTAVVAEKQ
ncbi:MAG: YbjQ family protein [Nitrospinota bacterium]|nr:YbjQ family protein [Nitrospinota bacterium]